MGANKTIKIPEFLREQLSTYSGLCEAVRATAEIFDSKLLSILESFKDLNYSDEDAHLHSLISWIRREFIQTMMQSYIPNSDDCACPPEMISMSGQLEDILTFGYESRYLTGVIIDCFDAHELGGYVNQLDAKEVLLRHGLRKSFIDIVTSWH